MKYIIHSNIEFDTTEYILKLLNDSKKVIKLSSSAGQILEELIKHRDTDALVTREHLFTIVWKSHGLEPSNGNLNQQVSLIRKTLTTLGLDPSCIITVPKKGLKLNNHILIQHIQDDNCVVTNFKENTAITQKNNIPSSFHSILLNFKTYINYIIALFVTIIVVFSMGLICFYNKTDNIKLYCCKEINACNLCPTPATAEPENNNDNLPYFEVI